MRKLIKLFIKVCIPCAGTGNRELPSGDTKHCYVCQGKGLV